MADNRHFIIALPDPNMAEICSIIVGIESTQTISIDGSKMSVKLYEGDTEDHEVLQNATEFTCANILIEHEKPEWYAPSDE